MQLAMLRAMIFALFAMLPLVPLAAQSSDPLTAEIELEDAERFAALFRATDGVPTAEQLQEKYLDHGGRALEIFSPNRIVDAQNLAEVIKANREVY